MRRRNSNTIPARQRASFGLVIVHLLIMTATEPLVFQDFRWYAALMINLCAFLLFGRDFVWRALGRYRWIFYTMGIGLVLSLFRHDNPLSELDLIVKMIVAVSTLLLIVPVLAHPKARKILVFGLLYVAFMKTIVVVDYTQNELLDAGILTGHGRNKNGIGLILALGIAVVTTFILSPKIQTKYRVLSCGLAVWYLYWMFTSGSRSATITAFASIMMISYMYFFNVKDFTTKMRIITFSFIVFAFTLTVVPILTSKFDALHKTYWRLIDFTTGKSDDINARSQLAAIALGRIQESPIIGSGLGSSKTYDIGGIRKFVHNKYLTEWVELGLPGILALLLFVVLALMELKNQMKKIQHGQEQHFDLALSLIIVPLMFMLTTIDAAVTFYYCIYAAFEYERNYRRYRPVIV